MARKASSRFVIVLLVLAVLGGLMIWWDDAGQDPPLAELQTIVSVPQSSPPETSFDFTLSTTGNWAFHQPLEGGASFRLQRTDTSLAERTFTSSREDSMILRQGESFSISSPEQADRLTVRHGSIAGPMSSIFLLPKYETSIKVSLIIYHIGLRPALKIQGEDGSTRYVFAGEKTYHRASPPPVTPASVASPPAQASASSIPQPASASNQRRARNVYQVQRRTTVGEIRHRNRGVNWNRILQ